MVEVELKASPIHGRGIFTRGYVKKGDIVWKHHPLVDITFDNEAYLTLEPVFKKFVSHYGYRQIEDGKWVLNADLAKFTNHSEDPTCVVGDDGFSRAIRDLPPGTEITEDYTSYASEGCVDGVRKR